MKWISVKDRLPEKEELILLGWDGKQFFPYDKIDRNSMSGIATLSNVHSTKYRVNLTHWMPLPEPPNEVD